MRVNRLLAAPRHNSHISKSLAATGRTQLSRLPTSQGVRDACPASACLTGLACSGRATGRPAHSPSATDLIAKSRNFESGWPRRDDRRGRTSCHALAGVAELLQLLRARLIPILGPGFLGVDLVALLALCGTPFIELSGRFVPKLTNRVESRKALVVPSLGFIRPVALFLGILDCTIMPRRVGRRQDRA